MKKSIFWMACLGACALVLAVRGKDKQDAAPADVDAEKKHTDREMLPVERDMMPQSTESVTAPAKVLPEVCFYTEKGGKWHTNMACRYLKNSTEIQEGSVDGARYAGKNQPCSVCAAAYIEY